MKQLRLFISTNNWSYAKWQKIAFPNEMVAISSCFLVIINGMLKQTFDKVGCSCFSLYVALVETKKTGCLIIKKYSRLWKSIQSKYKEKLDAKQVILKELLHTINEVILKYGIFIIYPSTYVQYINNLIISWWVLH